MITIIGNGKMALAIAKGLNGEVEVVGRNEEKLKKFCEESGAKKYHLLNEFDITNKTIILAVKPYALNLLSLKGEAKEVISIMAGKKIDEIKNYISAKIYSRVMPNVGAINQASTTAIFGSENAYKIFSKIGMAIKVNSEKELDIATAIAGSGPAFLAIIAEAIADGGVLCGMNRELSYEFTKGLFKSYASLNDKPSNIKDSVMSPAGTTAIGIENLEENGVRSAFIKAIKASYEKSQKM